MFHLLRAKLLLFSPSAGAASFVWIIVWFFAISSTPNDHPFISEAEKNYIVESIGPTVAEDTEDVGMSPP